MYVFLSVLLPLLVLASPYIARAQADLQTFILELAYFINDTLIPILFALAFLFFVYNAYRYFILGGANETAQQKGRQFALYAIAAFVIITAIWGIINFFLIVFNIQGNPNINIDYCNEQTGAGCDAGITVPGQPNPADDGAVTDDMLDNLPEDF